MARITGADIPTSLPNSEEEMDAREAGIVSEKVSRNSDVYDVTELRGISSFEDALALVQERMGETVHAEKELGTGFKVLNGSDKDRLLGVSFIILSMDFNVGDQGPFVSFLCVTENGGKFIVNDGSTGIYKTLDEYSLRGGKPGGLLVNGGLRKSEYDKEIEGKMTKAVTYYLNV